MVKNNIIKNVIDAVGVANFLVDLIMFEKSTDKKTAIEIYDYWCENDAYTSILDVGQAIDQMIHEGLLDANFEGKEQ